ncbi:hypothetical protein [Megalodesulfovibrio gigas]|uniref:HTH merR-type domain-containing protein n=1 Tax=Megalodesulfovibrio gigas (strain ATCC 19364 / DSM 1382 / NCIMB 9332 / VKM B-1759) TaxID=1121448 RepID=T2GDX0_MEGG1|nr:hypothetical protein [Megalodesulfovibrio gigas]AGW14498.1 hypothetical protein DGI_2768 [Megalodesulfovibrio gigas DSM 1382 = ATCC 19364]
MHNSSCDERLSLREISRRLGIPPSSVSYYKDRFGAYIPTCPPGNGASASSSRIAYPLEALQIFKEIRDMYTQHWTTDAIEQDLAAKLYGMHDPQSSANHAASSVLERLSQVLETQGAMRRELELLRDEVTSLRAKARDLDAQVFEERSQRVALALEVAELRDALHDALHDRKRQEETTQQSRRSRNTEAPHLDLPLVIRTAANEYLGVVGRTKPFSLRDFMHLVEHGSSRRGQVALSWQNHPPCWVLLLSANDPDTGHPRRHRMEVARVTTPSGNEVMQITRLAMDGVNAPEPFLLVLFRKIKEEFDG